MIETGTKPTKITHKPLYKYKGWWILEFSNGIRLEYKNQPSKEELNLDIKFYSKEGK